MHHAAMANKKEMMFALARLGCDWRARAEGIDGATAAFVLCGQHGKTTRQQVRAPCREAAALPPWMSTLARRLLSGLHTCKEWIVVRFLCFLLSVPLGSCTVHRV